LPIDRPADDFRAHAGADTDSGIAGRLFECGHHVFCGPLERKDPAIRPGGRDNSILAEERENIVVGERVE
jgi:hypothetical protein